MKQEALFNTDGIHIRDSAGRVCIWRGCNLGGDSKQPAVPGSSFFSREVSFTGRPFPLAEADMHFSRLRSWGFRFVRLVITWEAVEHSGPGIYDEEYLAYLREIALKAGEYGIAVYVDPHQDCWSRWTGGDGAPLWTLEAAGFDPARLEECGAAFTLTGQGERYIPMSWQMNNLRYGAATLFSLFFAGNLLAPGRYADGVPVQDWLQDHYIEAMRHTARRLKDCSAVTGFGTMNEPHYGFIGLSSLSSHHRITGPRGSVPTAFQAIAAASGFSQKIRRVALAGAVPSAGTEILNPDGVRLFREGVVCPWQEAGIWTVQDGMPVVKKDDWFCRPNGRELDFGRDCLAPFQKRFMDAFSRKHKHYLFFVEGVPFEARASWAADAYRDADASRDAERPRVVEAFHWYDGMTLLFKKWRPWLCADAETGRPVLGRSMVKRSFRSQLARLASRPRTEGIPALVGEFGVPFDLDGGRHLSGTSHTKAEDALGAYYDALDDNLLPAALWNYSASNTGTDGDGWNGENLSVWCGETDSARAVRGFCRPYAPAVAGLPVLMRFDRRRRSFVLEWDVSADMASPDEQGPATEVYVPDCWFEKKWTVSFSGPDALVVEMPEKQTVLIYVKEAGRARFELTGL